MSLINSSLIPIGMILQKRQNKLNNGGENISRKKRVWYKGATYHVMSRGVHRSAIFHEDEDYKIFLIILNQAIELFGIKVHAYCLMTNHFHLLISTSDIEVWKAMKYILSHYAIAFNHKYELSGHLFDKRYTDCLVEDTTYLLEVSRYIHLNPVKARMVKEPLAYKYSSYGAYVSNTQGSIADTSLILKLFSGDAREKYRYFVESKISHEEHELLIQKDMKEDENWLPW